MNNPVLPDAVRPGKHYSFVADMKLNAWALVALLMAYVCRWLLRKHDAWGVLLQTTVALFPLVPSLLYVRSIARWIGRMDELQRRIQLEACLFSTTATIFLVTAVSLLQGSGLLASMRLQHGLGWEGTFAAIVGFYVLGNVICNRGYK